MGHSRLRGRSAVVIAVRSSLLASLPLARAYIVRDIPRLQPSESFPLTQALRQVQAQAEMAGRPLPLGLRLPQPNPGCDGRFTPARAGFTSNVSRCWRHGSRHSCSHGFYREMSSTHLVAEGPLPLPRAGRPPQPPRRPPDRVTPARAGSAAIVTYPSSLRGRYVDLINGRLNRHGGTPARTVFTRRRDRARQNRLGHSRSRGHYRYSDEGENGPRGSLPLTRALPALAWYFWRSFPARCGLVWE